MPYRTTGSFIIEGRTYTCAYAVYKRHRQQGGTLTCNTITRRLQVGMRTWEELNRTADQKYVALGTAGGSSLSAKRKAAKAEMSALLRELDERKRKIRAI